MHPLDRHFRDSLTDLSASVVAMRPPMLTSRRGGGGCSRRRRPAGTLISWRGSCSRPAAVSTPSVRRGMRATPWLRWRRVRRIRPCSTTARGRSTWPEPGRCRVDASPRRAAGADGPGGRAHCGRSAQGLRPSRPGRHPADLHGCLSSPEGCWSGCRAASGTPAPSGLRVARGRGRGVLLRRRLGEPLHRSRRINAALATAFAACPYRFCSSAKTTASASRCRRRRVGSRRRTGPGPGWRTWRRTALIQPPRGRRSCAR